MASQLTYGELCSGVGGLSMAIEEIFNAEPAFHCEFDDAPRKVLEARWPDVPLYRDVKALNWEEMPRVDILGGGYPCQPFSLAGKRKAQDDERHLWPYIYEGVKALQPAYVYFENVYGHLSKGLSDVLLDLNEAGYKVAWGVQKASDVGAPHERKRVFIMGEYEPDAKHVDGLVIPISRGDKMPKNGLAINGGYAHKGDLVSKFEKGKGLKIPTANLATNGGSQHPDKRKAGGHGPNLADETEWLLTEMNEQPKLFLTPCAAEGIKGTPQLSRMKAKNGQVWLSNNVIDVAEVNAR